MPRADELVSCALRESRAMLREDLLLLPTLLAAARAKSSVGVFVEIGALDGKQFSNTLMLEKCFDWQGVLVEANPKNFAKLNVSGRRAHLVQSAVCSAGGGQKTVRFSLDGSETAGEFERLTSKRQALRRSRTVDVPCKPLSVILSEHGFAGADFLSLDVEGAEDKVLATVSPDAFTVIMVENNGISQKRVASLMRAASMRRARNVSVPFSDVWVRPGTKELVVAGARISPRITYTGPTPVIPRQSLMMGALMSGWSTEHGA